VPLIVNVREEGTPPSPLKVYVGTFNTPEINVEAPEEPVVVKDTNVAAAGVGIFNTLDINVAAPVPVVVNVIAFCLLLKVLQLAELNAPLFVADAVGILKV
jgi:hypothetical protein